MAAAITFRRPELDSWPEHVRVIFDDASYVPGSLVGFRLLAEEQEGNDQRVEYPPVNLSVRVWRVGQAEPVSDKRMLIRNVRIGNPEYQVAWQIPENTPTGRYSVTLEARHPESNTPIWGSEPVSFAVWRSEIVIENFASDRRFYAAGDPISFVLELVNQTDKHWTDLFVEVGESQYPWIAAPRGARPYQNFEYPESLGLGPGETRKLRLQGVIAHHSSPGTQNYTVTVRDGQSSRIVAFRTASPTFVRTPGDYSPTVYPPSYIHPDLTQVRVEGYRRFYSRENRGLSFDSSRTSYAAGEHAGFLVKPDAFRPCERANLELRTASGEVVARTEAQRNGNHLSAELQFGPPGLYEVVAQLSTPPGRLYEAGRLEVAANVLPRSLAVVCAHPDDEFLHPGIIRAAVENSLPVHIIYLTNGDAGGSERFFGPDYTPAEAIEFGHIRMAEARAAAQHLGVPEANLHFLGLPDGFLDAIWNMNKQTPPVFSPLLGVEHAPYRGVRHPNLPFRKANVVHALAEILAEINPDTVYTSHPDERHKDHSAAAWFTIESLRLLLAVGRLSSVPVIRVDQFYGSADGELAPFSYGIHEFYSSGEAMARVQEAYWYYQTQGGNHARGHVLSYSDLPRVERHLEILDWVPFAAHNTREVTTRRCST